MQITILSCVFSPEPVVSARTSAQLAEAFINKGHTVRVITNFPNRPQGSLYPGYRLRLYGTQAMNDRCSITRCYSTFSKRSSTLSRFLENLTFGVSSSLKLLFSQSPDVIYANTWPIFAQGLLTLVAKIKGIPVVLSIQDIYPESLVSQGRIKEGGRVYRVLLAIDCWITRGCNAIIVISDCFAHLYASSRGIPPEKIKVIPNWIDSRAVLPAPKSLFRKKCGIPEDAFVVVYGGNVGIAAGVENFLQALGDVKSEREIVLIIAGSGSQLTACQELSRNLSNARVLFHTPWLEEETSEVLGSADVLVLPTSGDQSLASVPSKMIAYMLAARPILAVAQPVSDTAKIIDQAKCGWVVPPGSQDRLAREIEQLAMTPVDCLEMTGQSGREYALNNFVSEVCLPKVIETIIAAGLR